MFIQIYFMGNRHLELKKFYSKQIRDGILTLRMDLTERDRLSRITSVTRRNKSDLVREALWDLFKKYSDILN